jgi:hypothetical protein
VIAHYCILPTAYDECWPGKLPHVHVE